MIFTNNIVLVEENLKEVNDRLDKERLALEGRDWRLVEI